MNGILCLKTMFMLMLSSSFLLKVKAVTAKREDLGLLQTKTVDEKLEVSGSDIKIVFDLRSRTDGIVSV